MRKSMKKLIALTLACLLLATLFVGCGKKDDGGSSGGDTIKLGWMGSLTGDQAAYGTCESQTLKMMVEDLNANGGLLGKQVELICYDTKGDAQEAVNVAKRLCAQDQVCAIVGSVLLGIMEIFVASFNSNLRDLFVYGLLILVLVIKPSGLMGKVVEDKA